MTNTRHSIPIIIKAFLVILLSIVLLLLVVDLTL